MIRPSRFIQGVGMAAVLAVAVPSAARGQTYESVGIRAQGMGGAFVAVADDATASWWNPAGLASGAYFSALLEFDTARQPESNRDAALRPVSAWRSGVRGAAVAFPALALSYYRLRISEIQPQAASTAAASLGRQDRGAAEVRLHSLVLNQFGATFGQSIGDHLVVASTLKLVRGSLGAEVRSGTDATLDLADDLSGSRETHGDLDLGWMVAFGPARVGLAVRNVTTPSFGGGGDRVELHRQARAGVALKTNARGRGASGTFAVDVDLTKTPTAVGDQRHVAAGAEVWSASREWAVRGGVSANTIGEARPSVSGGLSIGLQPGTYLDGDLTLGSDAARRGFGFAWRVTF